MTLAPSLPQNHPIEAQIPATVEVAEKVFETVRAALRLPKLRRLDTLDARPPGQTRPVNE